MRFAHMMMVVVIAVSLAGLMASDVRAGVEGGCDQWLSGPLHAQTQGINGIVECQTLWNPPTGGSLLVVGGSFSTAGGVAANRIAAWDGASWRALGSGMDLSVFCLTVYNGELIAGGLFSTAGGVPCNRIARWNGSVWQPLGTGLEDAAGPFTPACHELAVFNGELYAGGHFLTAGEIMVRHIARWNGSAWNSLAGPTAVGVNGTVPENVTVRAMTVLNNTLFVGGLFQTAASIPVSNVAKWTGTQWFSMNGSGTGVNNEVHALSQFNGELTVFGDFLQAVTGAGNISANHVARFNPTTQAWGTFGTGISNANARCVMNFNGGMIVGGMGFSGVPSPLNLAFWNGSTWSLFQGGISGVSTPFSVQVTSLSFFQGNVTVGGWFTSVGGGSVIATNIAQWTGSFWSQLFTPVPQVFAFETLGSRFIAGGLFTQSTTNQTPAHNIIGWNGATLTRVQNPICCGEGTNGTVRALKTITGAGGSTLLVGGDFTMAGGSTANRIAQYSESLGGGWSTLGAGFNGSVNAIERFNNVTYAGGSFTGNIAQFNSGAGAWFGLAFGVNGPVYAMKEFNGALYVGGMFTTANGLNTGGLARWTATGWSSVFPGFTGSVFALEVHNNELVIGGSFNGPSGANVVRLVGNSFVSLNPGAAGTNGVVNALKSDGTNLYIIGGFTSAGGVAVNKVARWNSITGWSNVDGGTTEVVQALGLYHGEINVGLGITFESGGGGGGGPEAAPQPGRGWVRYSPTGTVWIASNPSSQTVNCGQNVTFSAQFAQGYTLLLASWSRNGVALSDGPTPHGSIISGAHATVLAITNAQAADAGAYTCSFGNVCGGATSSAATLTVNNCCAPDVNGNGQVEVGDLLAVIMGWGACPAPPAACVADVTGDGLVNADDLLAVITEWGPCS